MDNIVKKLFEAGLLSEDDQATLQESFDARIEAEVSQVRESVETQVREEMAQRFEHDKSTLVEAMDRMLTDVVQKYESEKVAESAKLRESQARYDTAVKEARTSYKAKVKEHSQILESFVMKKLGSEISEFNEDKQAVSVMRLKLAEANVKNKATYKQRMTEQMALMRKFVVEKLDSELGSLRKQQKELTEQQVSIVKERNAERAQIAESMAARVAKIDKFIVGKVTSELREFQEDKQALVNERRVIAESNANQKKQIAESMAARVAKIDKFIVGKVTSELREFQEDKQALVNKRVQLISEAKTKLRETQRNFVREAAKLIDKKVSETMKVELKQLHEDLERNRQNMFGRRIFEAVATEFMTSYFSEGTEVKKMEKVVESLTCELSTVKQKLSESKQATDVAARKGKLAEEASTRTRVMSELLSPLARDKRAVMQELLESVKTTTLREAYTKYLPAVLNEGSKKVVAHSRQTLSETVVVKPNSCVAITGDQRQNRLFETVQAQVPEVSAETALLLKLAGITK